MIKTHGDHELIDFDSGIGVCVGPLVFVPASRLSLSLSSFLNDSGKEHGEDNNEKYFAACHQLETMGVKMVPGAPLLSKRKPIPLKTLLQHSPTNWHLKLVLESRS